MSARPALRLDKCRDFLAAEAPSLVEFAAWLTLNELAADGSPEAAAAIIELAESARSDTQLALLAIGPTRELLFSDSNNYLQLLTRSANSIPVYRILTSCLRYAMKTEQLHRALRPCDGAQNARNNIILERLASLPSHSYEPIPALPGRNGAMRGARVNGESSEPQNTARKDVDILISDDPLAAWHVLSGEIAAATDQDDFDSIGWYLGLLLDSAEEILQTRLLAALRSANFRKALDSAGVDGLSEDFIDACIDVLTSLTAT